MDRQTKLQSDLIDEFRETLQLVHRYGRKLVAESQQHVKDSTDQMRCKVFGLPMMQKQVIQYIVTHQDRDIYQKDIEKAFVISRSTASTMMKSLENKGMIHRESVSSDARLKRIVLNKEVAERFHEVHDYMLQHIDEISERMLRGLSDAEIKQFIKTLTRMKDNLKKEEKIQE